MVYIAHGDNIARTRILLNNQQKKLEIPNKIELDITEITPQELQEKLVQKDIFGKGSFVVVDITNAARMNLKEYVEVLKNTPDYATAVVLSAKTLSKANIFIKNKEVLNAKTIESIVRPTGNLFRFLDMVYTKNRKAAYHELHNLQTENQDPFKLFSMLLYSLRNITYMKFESSLYEKLRSFQKSKIKSQAKNFSKTQIQNLYEEFYRLEKKAKTGEIDPNLMLTSAVEKVLNS
jgi:DNA polymerase III delta subunit